MTMFSRRAFLANNAMGIGSVALAWMLQQENAAAKGPKTAAKTKPHNDLLPRQTHFEPRAKAMISLFQHGGPSHMDLTDPKPELTKYERDGLHWKTCRISAFVNRGQQEAAGKSI